MMAANLNPLKYLNHQQAQLDIWLIINLNLKIHIYFQDHYQQYIFLDNNVFYYHDLLGFMGEYN